MKKYILFIGLCCYAFLQLMAGDVTRGNKPQDSIWIYKGKLDIPDFDIPDVHVDMDAFAFNFNVDTSQIRVWGEDFNYKSYDLKELKKNMKISEQELSEWRETLKKDLNKGTLKKFDTDQKDKTPKRVENKTFSNISEIEFFHKYGNIVVRESKTRNVELEIQYFGASRQKDPVEFSSQKGLLSINSSSTRGNQVDFIISIPRNTKLNVDLKYGRLKMGEFSAAFFANLSYSVFDAEGFSGVAPVIKDKYGEVSISKLQDAQISSSYSKINIGKANRLDISGVYSDYNLNDVRVLSVLGASTSGDFRIGSIGEINGKFNYADISIDNLQSAIDASCNYSDIKINSVSDKAKINLKKNYSDFVISIPSNAGVSFNISLLHGDLNVSKKYTVNYTERTDTYSRSVRKGRIGSGNPTITIDVSGNYTDVKIK